MRPQSDVINVETGGVTDLARVLASEQQPARAREVAANNLSRIAGPEATRALVAGLDITEPIVLGAVVRALALRDEQSAQSRIAALASGHGLVGEAAAWAASLLRYRAGEGGDGVPPARAMLRPDPEKSADIVWQPASADAFAEAARAVGEWLPNFVPSTIDGLELTCGDRRLLVILDRDVVDDGLPSRIFSRKALVAVVAEHWSLEEDSWEVAYLVLSEPRPRPGEARISIVTLHGHLQFEGTATRHGDAIGVEVAGVAGPGNVPADITGTIAAGRVRFGTAVVGTERSHPRPPVLL
jgi:hypothetical protein